MEIENVLLNFNNYNLYYNILYKKFKKLEMWKLYIIF